MKKKIIGIDLGTTNSCVSIVEGGQPKVISNAEGARTTPSVVTIENDGKSLVGIMAKRQSGFKPNSTIIANKRLMGLSYEEAEKATQTHQPLFKMTRHNNGGVGIVIDNKTYTPQEISAKILSKLKVDAESYLGEPVTEAVITVPAYFNDAQRQATKDAAEIAGLKVARIINEPTAAAVAYGLDKQNAEETIVVYDLGGGTFDVSILKISEGVIETLSTHGDGWLGGEDIDNSIVQDIIDDFKSKNGVDLSKDIGALQRIKESAEKAKIELSSMQETEINLPYVTVDPVTGPKHLYYKLTKPKLNLLSEKLRKKTFASCDTALKNANLNASEIRKVVLVGGQTRDPEIQADVAKYFPNAKIEKGVNPDEVVAMGAAIQGAVLVGDVQGVVLLDVTPLSLGIETYGGVMTKMIEANTTIPTSKSQVFSTAADNQSSVEIRVFQGERSMANDNKLLGSFNLSDIPAAPKGVPQIEVTFNIDANGILNVAAKDKGTNKEQKITITNSSGLSKEEIEKLKKDAELNAEQDKKRMELVEVRNRAESLIYDAEKVIKENKEKLLPENINNLETKIKELKDIYNTEENKEIIENIIQVLQNEMITIQNELQKINSNNNSENTEGN